MTSVESLDERPINSRLETLLEGVEGWLPLPLANILFERARSSPSTIVEIGSYRGRSTIALALGAEMAEDSDITVFSIEPHAKAVGAFGGKFGPEDREAYFRNLLQAGLAKRAALVNLPSEQIGSVWQYPIGLLFIDGDHHYEAVKKDAEIWLPHLLPGATVIFDDATNPDGGPFRVTEELVASREYEIVNSIGKFRELRRR